MAVMATLAASGLIYGIFRQLAEWRWFRRRLLDYLLKVDQADRQRLARRRFGSLFLGFLRSAIERDQASDGREAGELKPGAQGKLSGEGEDKP